MRRIGVFGWGVVAPQCPDVETFEKKLFEGGSWLEPFSEVGPSTFLVGRPHFELEAYREWISARFPRNRLHQIAAKIGLPGQYAIGAFIQALGQNPGLEEELQALGGRAHVYVGTGLGDLLTVRDAALGLERASRRWNRFWADPARNTALREALERGYPAESERLPVPPGAVDPGDREAVRDAEDAYDAYWAARSPELQSYLSELAEVETVCVEGPVEAGKRAALHAKQLGLRDLERRWGCPPPPWSCVPATVLWNIPNGPASQISMLGRITGFCFAPVSACATFGAALHLAIEAIRSDRASAVVIGAADAPPNALTVGGFYDARAISADGRPSIPLTALRGTHVAGGACVWIVGDLDYLRSRGFRPLGLEPLAVAMSADADHIITPSVDGPRRAIRAALAEAGADGRAIATWDLHATATPGDYLEVENLAASLGALPLLTARKGSFGHGMSVGGGWELTAQYLAGERGEIAPTLLRAETLHAEIAQLGGEHVLGAARPLPRGLAGKLSMGVGGVNACVISAPFADD